SKTQPASPFKGGEPVVHHERAARALERLGILCYDVAKPMKEYGCQETVFTNSLVGTKTGGRPTLGLVQGLGGRSSTTSGSRTALAPCTYRPTPTMS
ncbi:MAG: hypothetical protein PHT43_07130, partial [Anaerolineaceae bacterium]|nr:hypothetical protein [Anaerolineaceae bacterium]